MVLQKTALTRTIAKDLIDSEGFNTGEILGIKFCDSKDFAKKYDETPDSETGDNLKFKIGVLLEDGKHRSITLNTSSKFNPNKNYYHSLTEKTYPKLTQLLINLGIVEISEIETYDKLPAKRKDEILNSVDDLIGKRFKFKFDEKLTEMPSDENIKKMTLAEVKAIKFKMNARQMNIDLCSIVPINKQYVSNKKTKLSKKTITNFPGGKHLGKRIGQITNFYKAKTGNIHIYWKYLTLDSTWQTGTTITCEINAPELRWIETRLIRQNQRCKLPYRLIQKDASHIIKHFKQNDLTKKKFTFRFDENGNIDFETCSFLKMNIR